MSFGSFPGTRAGAGVPPVEVAQKVELTRGGDPLAREIFETLAYEPLHTTMTPAQWEQLRADLTSNQKTTRERAKLKLAELGEGRTKRSLIGARDAVCLILATFGLTLEQIALVFGHAKGHIARKIDTAARNYRQTVGLPEGQSHQIDPVVTRRERWNLKRRARRLAQVIQSLPLPARRFLLEQLNHELNRPRRH